MPDYVNKHNFVPKGGRWFPRQAPMLQAYTETGGFPVAWDTREGGSKCYGLYPNAEDYYQNLLLNRPEHRWGYELIPETAKCKLYCDIEWVGPQDKEHKKLRWILCKLTKHCQECFNRTPKLYYACGSRKTGDGTYKNSYHVACPTIVFDSNHDGEMHRFFQELCVGPEWYYLDEKKQEPKCFVDFSVYNKNRCFRLPYCSKKGTPVPMVRITGDPFDPVNFGSTYEHEDPEGWRHFILTNPAIDGDTVQFPSPPVGTKKKSSQEAPEGVAKKRAKHANHDDDGCLIPLHQIEQVLASFGDTASKAKWAKKVDGDEPRWKVQCDKEGKTRVCLHGDGEIHDKNNCLVFLTLVEPNKVLVEYHCTSSECRKEKKHKLLGAFRLRRDKWVFFKRGEASDSDASDVSDGRGDEGEEPSAEGDQGDAIPMEDVGGRENHGRVREKQRVSENVSHHDTSDLEDGGTEAEDGKACEGEGGGASEAEACEGEGGGASEAEDGEACKGGDSHGGRQGKSAKASGKKRSRRKKRNSLKSRDPDPEEKTYEKVKGRFEEEVFKVRNPFVYIRTEERNGVRRPTQFKHAELKQFYSDWHYCQYDNNKEKWVDKPFIDAWLRDPCKRQVYTIVVDPRGTQEDVYNMWTGFKASGLEASDYFRDIEDVESFVMGPIIHHFDHVITGGNQEHTEWLLDWMANIVQRPWQKTQVPISLYGKQGCGKGIIFEWFRKDVLGPDHSFQTADPERDLFGRFSEGLINKAFVQIDEVKSLHDHMDKLKNAVTSDTLTWEQKHGRVATVDNICNILFTSNNANTLGIPGDDRRFVLFRCDPKYKGDTQYFQNLADHLNTPGVSPWFLQILQQRDLSKYPYHFQTGRPITEYYRESQQATISQEMRYLSALVNSQIEREWGGKELYEHYREWAKSEGVNPIFIKSNPIFTKEIQSVDGVQVRRSGGIKYRFDKQRIKSSLKQSGEYYVNACFHV